MPTLSGSPPPALPPAFEVSGYRVEPSLNRMTRGGVVRQLEPKVMAVLVKLAEHPGELVSRESLMSDVWGDVHVGEDVLTRSVAELRKLFADDPREPRVIETIRKRGYRLLEPIDAAAPKGRAPRPVAFRSAALAALLAVTAAALFVFADRDPQPENAPRLVPLTSLPGTERDPAVSPDGTRVAYSVVDEETGRAALFVQLRDEERRRPLTEGSASDRYPAWSPDGTRLAFVRRHDGGCSLMLTSVLGGEESRLAECNDRLAQHMDWAPNGRHLAIVDRDEAGVLSAAIHLLDLRTLERRQLSHPRAPYRGDVEPAFSPDGRHVAFVRILGGTVSDLWMVDVRSGEERRLTFDGRDVVGQGFSPDGQSVVFSSNRGGTYGLWRIPVRGGEPRWLTGGGSKIKHPSHARQAEVVAYEDWRFEINVWELALDGAQQGEPSPVITSTQWDYAPAASPLGSGERVAFVATRSGDAGLWIRDAVGEPARRISPPGMELLSPPRWSADAKRLVFAAFVDGQADVWIQAPEEVLPTRLTHDAAAEIGPAWSRDGGAVLFGVLDGDSWSVRRRLVAGDAEEVLDLDSAMVAREARDGSLYWLKSDGSGLWRRSPEEGTDQLVVPDLPPSHWADWEVNGLGVYYVRPGQDPGTLDLWFRGHAAQERPRRLVPLGELARSGIAVRADGSRLLYSRVDRAECDLLVAENLG